MDSEARKQSNCNASGHMSSIFCVSSTMSSGVMAILEQRVFDSLRAVDEQAAIEPALFLDDPVTATVLADEDDGGRRSARWRFDEFHFDFLLG